jgi:hypothetical protein
MVSTDGWNPVLDGAEIVLNTSGQKEILKDRYKLVFNYVFINKSVLELWNLATFSPICPGLTCSSLPVSVIIKNTEIGKKK